MRIVSSSTIASTTPTPSVKGHLQKPTRSSPGRRQRIKQACSRCRVKKTKCSGGQICSNCREQGAVCVTIARGEKSIAQPTPELFQLVQAQRDKVLEALVLFLEDEQNSPVAARLKLVLNNVGVDMDQLQKIPSAVPAPFVVSSLTPDQSLLTCAWDDDFLSQSLEEMVSISDEPYSFNPGSDLVVANMSNDYSVDFCGNCVTTNSLAFHKEESNW